MRKFFQNAYGYILCRVFDLHTPVLIVLPGYRRVVCKHCNCWLEQI